MKKIFNKKNAATTTTPAPKKKEYKTPMEKTWRFMRQDVTEERAIAIADEMADAMFDRMHNAKECVKHPFKSEKRETRPTKHHWE